MSSPGRQRLFVYDRLQRAQDQVGIAVQLVPVLFRDAQHVGDDLRRQRQGVVLDDVEGLVAPAQVGRRVVDHPMRAEAVQVQ